MPVRYVAAKPLIDVCAGYGIGISSRKVPEVFAFGGICITTYVYLPKKVCEVRLLRCGSWTIGKWTSSLKEERKTHLRPRSHLVPACPHSVRARYSLGTNMNTPLFQVLTPEFKHGPGTKVGTGSLWHTVPFLLVPQGAQNQPNYKVRKFILRSIKRLKCTKAAIKVYIPHKNLCLCCFITLSCLINTVLASFNVSVSQLLSTV